MADPDPVDLGIPGLHEAAPIGAGGFATVYRAYQPAFDRVVAVKVLDTVTMDGTARARFERECRALGSISGHPGIVTVHDAGFNAWGRPYLVMAFVGRGSVADRLEAVGRYGWEEAARIGVKLAAALETAHRAGIVHRDIKPANVLLSDFGDPLLSDFGIARIAGGPETRSGVITASFAHAAPEILSGERPTERSDVYSLASTLYAMVTGRSPFQRTEEESLAALVARIVSQPVPSLVQLGIPVPFAAVLERGLAKDPSARFGSALELGRALRAVQREAGIAPTEMAVGDGSDDRPVAPVPPTTRVPLAPQAETVDASPAAAVLAPASPPGGRRLRRRKTWAWISALMVLAGIGGTVAAVVVIDPFGPTPTATTAGAPAETAPIVPEPPGAPVTTEASSSPTTSARSAFQTAAEAFVGTWEADDADGSHMWLQIAVTDMAAEQFGVALYDNRIAACGVPGLLEVEGRAVTASSLETVSGQLRCRDESGRFERPAGTVRISLRTLGVEHLIDGGGVVWEQSDMDFSTLTR